MKKKAEKIYLGLNVGTNSIGYAVTDEQYNLLKFNGNDAWGSIVFDAASSNEDRRNHRLARRNLDRRQQRIVWLQEIFAKEISKVDDRFFIRLSESFRWREDVQDQYVFFNDKEYTDVQYMKENPTIHHLICELMDNKAPHDVRLVYLACAWLIAHRGHFLNNLNVEKLDEMQIEHRGDAVRAALNKRKNARRNRRSRETGYRRAKWGNRCLSEKDKRSYDSSREDGWLPPSIRSAADNVISWVRRLGRWINLTECSFEAVRFDTQLMEDPDIEGEEYQHGTLFGLEIKEYLMEKFGHTCQYCGGKSGDPVLEWEHMRPKSRGGSDRVKNALLSCSSCNKDKGNRTPEEWLEQIKARLPREKGKRKELDEERVKLIQKVIDGKPQGSALRYAAWVSSSRRYLEKALFGIFGDVECSSGGRTKYNRTELGYPKEHHYDALCVGTVPEKGYHDRTNGYYLYAKAAGRGTRLRGHINKCGVIATKWTDRKKGFFGFQTGDIVVAEVPHKTPKPYKYEGRFVGRVMVRATGSFDIKTTDGKLVTVKEQYCRLLQANSGYHYTMKRAIPLGH